MAALVVVTLLSLSSLSLSYSPLDKKSNVVLDVELDWFCIVVVAAVVDDPSASEESSVSSLDWPGAYVWNDVVYDVDSEYSTRLIVDTIVYVSSMNVDPEIVYSCVFFWPRICDSVREYHVGSVNPPLPSVGVAGAEKR